MKRVSVRAIFVTWAFASLAHAASTTVGVAVSAGDHDRVNVPVRVPLGMGKQGIAGSRSAVLETPDGRRIVGQLTAPGLVSQFGSGRNQPPGRELHFILPKLGAGETVTLECTFSDAPPPPGTTFRWHDTPGEYNELRFGDRPVLRYMYKALDDSNPRNRELTYKVYHHVFDPKGTRLVTKGPGGRYTHHRGLFYGYNKIRYDGNNVDTWHCKGDTHLSHEGFLASEEGPVLGRHRVAVDWHGVGKKVFAKEEREMTVYAVPGGRLIEFASRLRSTGGNVKLAGDPQHAGFQFRADNEVAAKTKGQTYYLRPDGKGKKGETRNWPGRKDFVNLPWNAMSFVLGDQRYTCCYLDKPTNPKEARYSERDYGRFGSYFEFDLDGSNSLDINYRIWLQEGEMTGDGVAAKSADFVEPVKATLKQDM